MRYDYKCPHCGWSGERVADLATRNNLACIEPIEPLPDRSHVLDAPDGPQCACGRPSDAESGACYGHSHSPPHNVCAVRLERDPNIALTAKMSHFWQP